MIPVMPPIYVQGPLIHILVEHSTFSFLTLRGVSNQFGEVQTGFLQLLLTQTWMKCTSLDSTRCVVYSGIRFKAIRASSKKLEQEDEW